ncbi:MAG: hypothetical protein HY276_10875, partial [Ignavibacteriales bacterium]|nr:hypothetical protein [Ignavibacteriales bacterium]
MKFKHILITIQTLFVFVLFALVAGCDKKDNPAGAEITETNLFPAVVGHIYVYSGYDLDTTSSQKIQSSVHRVATLVQGTATIAGKTAYRLVDSMYTPAGKLNVLDTTYVVNENGDLLVYQNGQWQTYFKKSAGVNVEYDIGMQSEMSPIGPISIPLKGKIYPKASITLPYGTVEAYKLEVKASINFSGVSFEVV